MGDFFKGYPPGHSSMGGNRAGNGGQMPVKPTSYSPPQGPKGIMDKGVGLGGNNMGNCGTQGSYHTPGGESGAPGIGGSNMGNKGTQR